MLPKKFNLSITAFQKHEISRISHPQLRRQVLAIFFDLLLFVVVVVVVA